MAFFVLGFLVSRFSDVRRSSKKFRAQALEWNWISGSRPFLAMLVMLPLLTLVVMTVVGKLYCCPAADGPTEHPTHHELGI